VSVCLSSNSVTQKVVFGLSSNCEKLYALPQQTIFVRQCMVYRFNPASFLNPVLLKLQDGELMNVQTLCVLSGPFVHSFFHREWVKQGVALTGRNITGPPCSRRTIIRLEAAWRHRLACAGEAACRLAVDCYRRRRRQTTTDASDRY